MGLTLSEVDVERLHAAQVEALSVSEAPSTAAWATRFVDRVGHLFRSDRTVMLLPHPGGLHMELHPSMRPFEDVVRGIISEVEPGAIRFAEEAIDHALEERRRRGLSVWRNETVHAFDGRPLHEVAFYHEFMVPADVVDGGGLTVPCPVGEAMLCTVPGHPGSNPFGDDWLMLARLLLPAFESAVHALQQGPADIHRIMDTLDHVSDPIAIVMAPGHAVYRNASLRRLLERVPDPGDLVAGMMAEATLVLGLGAPRSKTRRHRVASSGARDIVVGGFRYRIRVRLLSAGAVSSGRAALVVVEERTPVLPDERTLQRDYGLTPREAQVALLLARGASNVEAARALGISHHTVRSHAESIFRKLDVRSRKALALHLLGGFRPES